MALIKCPNCGEKISDKAVECVHCGQKLKDEVIIEKKCEECGSVISENDTLCPVCGCPIVDRINGEKEEQNVKLTNVQINFDKKKRNRIIAIIVAIIVIGVCSVFGINQYEKKKQEELVKNYQTNMELVVNTMLSGAADSEKACNLIKNVWYNAIYKKSDSETDKYTKSGGVYVDDFNDALSKLFSDSSFTSDISQIKNNQEKVKDLMKELKDPPEGYEEAYKDLKELYDAYNNLVDCAIDPNGSFTTYSSTFSEADNNTVSSYKTMLLYIGE